MRLSKREKFLVLLLLLLAIGVLGFRFGLKPQMDTRQTLLNSISNAQSEYFELQTRADLLTPVSENVLQLREQAAAVASEYFNLQSPQELDPKIHALLSSFGIESRTLSVSALETTTLPGYAPYSQGVEYAAGAALSSLQPQPAEPIPYAPTGTLPRIRFQFSYESSYGSLRTFLDAIAGFKQGVRIEELYVQRAPVELPSAEELVTIPEDTTDWDFETAYAEALANLDDPGLNTAVLVSETKVMGTFTLDVYMADKYVLETPDETVEEE